MVPAHPPLPTACSLLFQPEDGSQTSTLMSESDEGVNVALTRQKAGSCANALDRALPRPPGEVKAPGPTLWTASIRPAAMESERSSSHEVPAAWMRAGAAPKFEAANAPETAVAVISRWMVFMTVGDSARASLLRQPEIS